MYLRCTYKSKWYKGMALKIRDHECKECDIRFSTASKLTNHRKCVHDKIKDHVCEQCGVAMSMAANLRDHIRVVHEQIRNFKCEECGYEFSSRSNLKKHMGKQHKHSVKKVDPDPLLGPTQVDFETDNCNSKEENDDDLILASILTMGVDGNDSE